MNNGIFGDFAAAILPILALILTGAAARWLLLRDEAIWTALDRVNFRLLIPALIIGTLTRIDISEISGWRIMLVIAAALAGIALILWLCWALFVPRAMDVPAFTSVFQTATRWNASIALVVAELIFDSRAVAVVALIMVILMPLVNVINITVLARALGGPRASPFETLKTVARNPIILACLIGIGLSTLHVPLPQTISRSLSILGEASIGTILLSLGAGLNIQGFKGRLGAIGLSGFLKLVVMPGLVLALGGWIGLEPRFVMIATIATAMPTAAHGYAVAQQMGGDAPLYASSCTAQLLLSFVTVPLWILFCLSLSGGFSMT